jgi:hypothetical protein
MTFGASTLVANSMLHNFWQLLILCFFKLVRIFRLTFRDGNDVIHLVLQRWLWLSEYMILSLFVDSDTVWHFVDVASKNTSIL